MQVVVDFWQQHLAELTMTDNAARLLYAGIVGIQDVFFILPLRRIHSLSLHNCVRLTLMPQT